jgi:hypothetical protein
MDKVSTGTNNAKEAVSKTMNAMKNVMDSAMAGNCYLIVVYLVCIIFLIIFSYSVYLRKEFSKSKSNLEKMKKTLEADGEYAKIIALTDADYEKEGDYGAGTKFALIDYHIMGSYNSCGTGPAVNGWVSEEALEYVIERGVRFLDFEIYLKKGKAVVALQARPYPGVASKNLNKCNTCKFKDTLNELNIATVLETVKRNAIDSGNNNTDPLILSFRVMSDNDTVYSILAKTINKIFKGLFLPAKYGYCGIVKTTAAGDTKGYSGNGKKLVDNNVFFADLSVLKGKVIIFAKGPPNNPKSYKNNIKFFELMNAGDEDGKLNYKSDYRIKNDTETFNVREHKYNYCVTMPDITTKKNSMANLHFLYGCQAILMNFGAGFNDTQMKYYKKKFSEKKRAFILKAKKLRRTRVFAGAPTPQDSKYDPIRRDLDCPIFGTAGKTYKVKALPGGKCPT